MDFSFVTSIPYNKLYILFVFAVFCIFCTLHLHMERLFFFKQLFNKLFLLLFIIMIRIGFCIKKLFFISKDMGKPPRGGGWFSLLSGLSLYMVWSIYRPRSRLIDLTLPAGGTRYQRYHSHIPLQHSSSLLLFYILCLSCFH